MSNNPGQNSNNNEENITNPQNPQNNNNSEEENPPNNQQNPQENPLNQQNPQNNDDEAVSRPRRRARGQRNANVNPTGRGYRTLTRPPMQISWENVQVALGPAPPAPRQLRPRAPRPMPLQPPVSLNWAWRCPVCRRGFFNMRSLCGHIRVHKNRNWKGIHPPPELCKPQGLGTIKDLYAKKDYNPLTMGNDRMLPSLLGVGGGLGMSQQFVPWVPPMHNSNYQGGMGTGFGGDTSSLGDVNFGKRPTVIEEEERSQTLRRTRRTRVGEVPDLNVSIIPHDDEPETEVQTGEGSGAPDDKPEPHHEQEIGKEVRDEPDHEQEGIIEGSNSPHAAPDPEEEGRKLGDDAPNDEPEHIDKGKEGTNALHDGTEPKEEGIEENNAQRDEPEAETAAEVETKIEGEEGNDE